MALLYETLRERVSVNVGWVERSETQQTPENVGFRSSVVSCQLFCQFGYCAPEINLTFADTNFAALNDEFLAKEDCFAALILHNLHILVGR